MYANWYTKNKTTPTLKELEKIKNCYYKKILTHLEKAKTQKILEPKEILNLINEYSYQLAKTNIFKTNNTNTEPKKI